MFINGLHRNLRSRVRIIFVQINQLIHIIIISNNMINVLVYIFNQILHRVYVIRHVRMYHHLSVNYVSFGFIL